LHDDVVYLGFFFVLQDTQKFQKCCIEITVSFLVSDKKSFTSCYIFTSKHCEKCCLNLTLSCTTSALGDEPRQMLKIIRRFGKRCSCHLLLGYGNYNVWGSRARLIPRPDNRGSKHLWNIGKLLPHYTAQHPRRQSSSYSPPWEPEIWLRLHSQDSISTKRQNEKGTLILQ
jgi:hypothetical protein